MAGGAMNEAGVLKAGRIHQIAMQNRLPTITLTQSVSENHLWTRWHPSFDSCNCVCIGRC